MGWGGSDSLKVNSLVVLQATILYVLPEDIYLKSLCWGWVGSLIMMQSLLWTLRWYCRCPAGVRAVLFLQYQTGMQLVRMEICEGPRRHAKLPQPP